jgi:cation diffusion facilitator CzcD-associated flavoprotein CzcO
MMMPDTDVAVLGAGPYGLSVTAHLRRAGVECRVFGDPMSFWRGMPTGMLLRSNWTATCIAEYEGPLSIDTFIAQTGARFGRPVPLDRFIEYGMWVQGQVAADVDTRSVGCIERDDAGFRITLADGQQTSARRVVVAAGIGPFPHRPSVGEGLPPELVSHTADHRDLARFAGSSVLVVGGGQSALESAALLKEGGAEAEVIVREDHIHWLHGGKYHRMLGRATPLVYAPTDVGPMGLSRLVAVPDLFRRMPRRVQDPLAGRSIRPAGAAWLAPRLREVPVNLGCRVESVRSSGDRVITELSDGSTRTVDHVLFGTGYRVDVARYDFLSPGIIDAVQRVHGYPVLSRGLESSLPGLHFVGAPAARSFGPIMRFVSGGWYAARSVTACVARASQASRTQFRAGSSHEPSLTDVVGS